MGGGAGVRLGAVRRAARERRTRRRRPAGRGPARTPRPGRVGAPCTDALAGIRALVDHALVVRAGGTFWSCPTRSLGARRARHRRRVPAPDQQDSARASAHVLAARTTGTPSWSPAPDPGPPRALPIFEEGDSGVDAVVTGTCRRTPTRRRAGGRRQAAATATPADRLRLRDVLLWLSTTLRLRARRRRGSASPRRGSDPGCRSSAPRAAGRRRRPSAEARTRCAVGRTSSTRPVRAARPPRGRPGAAAARRAAPGRGPAELQNRTRSKVRGVSTTTASLQQSRGARHPGDRSRERMAGGHLEVLGTAPGPRRGPR